MVDRTNRAVLILGALMLASPVVSQAQQVLGELWQNVPTSGGNASIVPAGAPDAKFYSPAIDYNSANGYTPAGFLNHPAFFDTSGSFNPNGSFNDTFIRFTGQTYLNLGANSFVVPHDDGLTLWMGGGLGLVVNQPGPTSPVNTPFTVNAPAAGLYDFVLQYGECCGAPAVLGFKINGAPVGNVPDVASTVLLLGLGMSCLAAFRRR